MEVGSRVAVEVIAERLVAGVEVFVKGVRRGWPSVNWLTARGWKRAVVRRGRRKIVRRIEGIFVVVVLISSRESCR